MIWNRPAVTLLCIALAGTIPVQWYSFGGFVIGVRVLADVNDVCLKKAFYKIICSLCTITLLSPHLNVRVKISCFVSFHIIMAINIIITLSAVTATLSTCTRTEQGNHFLLHSVYEIPFFLREHRGQLAAPHQSSSPRFLRRKDGHTSENRLRVSILEAVWAGISRTEGREGKGSRISSMSNRKEGEREVSCCTRLLELPKAVLIFASS